MGTTGKTIDVIPQVPKSSHYPPLPVLTEDGGDELPASSKDLVRTQSVDVYHLIESTGDGVLSISTFPTLQRFNLRGGGVRYQHLPNIAEVQPEVGG